MIPNTVTLPLFHHYSLLPYSPAFHQFISHAASTDSHPISVNIYFYRKPICLGSVCLDSAVHSIHFGLISLDLSLCSPQPVSAWSPGNNLCLGLWLSFCLLTLLCLPDCLHYSDQSIYCHTCCRKKMNFWLSLLTFYLCLALKHLSPGLFNYSVSPKVLHLS